MDYLLNNTCTLHMCMQVNLILHMHTHNIIIPIGYIVVHVNSNFCVIYSYYTL